MISRRSLIQRIAALAAVPASAVATLWKPKAVATPVISAFPDSFTWTIPYPVVKHSQPFAMTMMQQMAVVTDTNGELNGKGETKVMTFTKTGLTPELHTEIETELNNLASHIPDFTETWPFNEINVTQANGEEVVEVVYVLPPRMLCYWPRHYRG